MPTLANNSQTDGLVAIWDSPAVSDTLQHALYTLDNNLIKNWLNVGITLDNNNYLTCKDKISSLSGQNSFYPEFDVSNGFTLTLWVEPTATLPSSFGAFGDYYLNTNTNTQSGFYLGENVFQYAFFYIGQGYESGSGVSTGPYVINTPGFVACTYSPNNLLNVYYNINQNNYVSCGAMITSTSQFPFIFNAAGNNSFIGKIWDIRLYDKVKSITDISSIGSNPTGVWSSTNWSSKSVFYPRHSLLRR